MSSGAAKDDVPSYLPPASEPYERSDATCCNSCLISGVCCKNCWVCTAPNCCPALCLRRLVSTNKCRFEEQGFKLDLIYLTSRIVVHGFPSVGPETMWRNPRSEMLRFFDSRHSDHYRIYNFAVEPGRVYSREEFYGRTRLYPFLDHNVPPLGLIADFCSDAGEFTESDPSNVVGLHCKAGKGRSGVMACCLLLRLGEAPTAAAAMEYYDARRVKGNKRGLTVPTQRRYVRYYERMLKCGVTSSLRVWNPVRILRKVVLSQFPGHMDGPHELALFIRSGVQKEHLLYESYAFTAPGTFHCDVPVQGNVYVEVRSGKKKISDFWINTWFVGRAPGEECLPSDNPESFAAEYTKVTGRTPPGLPDPTPEAAEPGVAAGGPGSDAKVVPMAAAASPASASASSSSPSPGPSSDAAPAAAAAKEDEKESAGGAGAGAGAGAEAEAESGAGAGVDAEAKDTDVELLDESSTMDDPVNMVVIPKLDMDKYKKDTKHKKAPRDYVVTVHFEPLFSPRTLAANRGDASPAPPTIDVPDAASDTDVTTGLSGAQVSPRREVDGTPLPIIGLPSDRKLDTRRKEEVSTPTAI